MLRECDRCNIAYDTLAHQSCHSSSNFHSCNLCHSLPPFFNPLLLPVLPSSSFPPFILVTSLFNPCFPSLFSTFSPLFSSAHSSYLPAFFPSSIIPPNLLPFPSFHNGLLSSPLVSFAPVKKLVSNPERGEKVGWVFRRFRNRAGPQVCAFCLSCFP